MAAARRFSGDCICRSLERWQVFVAERVVATLSLAVSAALGSSLVIAQVTQPPAVPVACRLNAADTLDANFVRAGFGSLKQDDISLKVTLTGGLQVTATPLEERIIRLLAPDSYRNLCQNRASKQKALAEIFPVVRAILRS